MKVKIYTYEMENFYTKELFEFKTSWTFKIGRTYEVNFGCMAIAKRLIKFEEAEVKKLTMKDRLENLKKLFENFIIEE